MRITEIQIEGTNGNTVTVRRKGARWAVEADILTPAGRAHREVNGADQSLWDLAVHIADALEPQPFHPHQAVSYCSALRSLMA